MSDRGSKSRRSVVWPVFFFVVAVAAFVLYKAGWVGYGFAELRAETFPRDESLLEWMPADTSTVAILDPHQIRAKALGRNLGSLGATVQRIRNDIKKAAGVDLAFDVDKIALAPSLVVLRGRFNGDTLAARLGEYKYATTGYAGRSYLVRPGEDAVLVSGDDLLVYGDEASIKASIDAKAGLSLARNEAVTARLARVGWDHGVLVTAQLASDRPSLRSIIVGGTGPRGLTIGIQGGEGVDVRVCVEAASPGAASDLAKWLEAQRAGLPSSLQASTGAELAGQLAELAKSATIDVDSVSGQVDLRAHVTAAAVDSATRAALDSAPLREAYKAFRIYQLLAPLP